MTPLGLAMLVTTFLVGAQIASAQGVGTVAGRVADETGGVLPGVSVHAHAGGTELETVTDAVGRYRLDGVPAGRVEVEFRLINFTVLRRTLDVAAGQTLAADALMRLALSADIVVTAPATFRNIADVANPAENLVGHRVVGEPGRDHRRAARGPADHARGRSARDRTGHDRQPAQRRGQSQPVLPARVQPRSRHRLLRHGGRRAGQYANRRACPRLRGRQLADSGAGERRPVQEGSRTSPTRATSPPPAPPTSTT